MAWYLVRVLITCERVSCRADSGHSQLRAGPHVEGDAAQKGGERVRPGLHQELLFVGAAGMSHDQQWALFLIGAAALLLLFVGIHNAWDTVAYVVGNPEGSGNQEKPK